MLTQSFLKECFSYDENTGILRWNTRPRKHFDTDRAHNNCNSKHEFKEAGYIPNHGYRSVGISGKYYLVHRIIFMIVTGDMPEFVDHINGVKTDNRWSNLRQATREQNNRNSRVRKDNTSGVKGVQLDRKSGNWKVCITVDGTKKYIGRFDDLELAELVAQEAREHYHGEFARHD